MASKNHSLKKASRKTVTFHDAIARGLHDQVAAYLEKGEVSVYTPTDDKFCPFEVAVKNRRWRVALTLWQHHDAHEEMLPTPDQPLSAWQPHPLAGTTPNSKALLMLLHWLSMERSHRPLPKADMADLKKMVEAVAKEDGDWNRTFLRLVRRGPEWATKAFADSQAWAGVNPNAYATDPNTGEVDFLLGLAALRGHASTLEALLEKGANPLYRNHRGQTAAHLAMDIRQYYVSENEACSLDMLEGRLACLDRLMSLEGVAESACHRGKTPAMVKEEGIEWVHSRPLPEGKGVTGQDVATYKQRLQDLLLPQVEPSRRPRL